MATVFKRNGKGNWIIQWYDHGGVRREKSSRTTDKRRAEQLGRKLESDAMLRREGIINPADDRLAAHRVVPILAHLEEYIEEMRHRGCSARHVQNVEAQLRRVIADTEAKRLTDLDAVNVQRHLRALRTVPVKQLRPIKLKDGEKPKTLGPRTINAVRAAVIAFLNWSVKGGRITSNPCLSIPKVDEMRDQRVKRRALTVEELGRLVESSEARGTFYLVAATTGLRMGEMASLTWGDIDLDTASIHIPASKGKSKRDDWIAITGEVVEALQELRPSKAGAMLRVFRTSPTTRTFASDLKQAGIPEYDDQGRRVDRHALRMTAGTLLARAGVSPQQAQRQMRHADIKTTLAHYTELRLADHTQAVAKLPVIRGTAGHSARNAGAETGASSPAEPQHFPQHSRRKSAQNDAEPCNDLRKEEQPDESGKARFCTRKHDKMRDIAKGNNKAGDRSRTGDIQLGKLTFYH